MPFFRRRPRRVAMRPFDEAGLGEAEPVTLERALEEGMLITDFAVRMTIRNAIVTAMLTEPGAVFTPELFVGAARQALLDLAEEADSAEERMAAERRLATVLEGEPEHSHDYRPADAINLGRREALARATAAALRRRSEDAAFLAAVVEAARAEAWAEVSREIELRIDRTFTSPDPMGMDQRLQELRADLRLLMPPDS